MATTTNVQNLKLNVLTQAQYSSATKETNEIYLTSNGREIGSRIKDSGDGSNLTDEYGVPIVEFSDIPSVPGDNGEIDNVVEFYAEEKLNNVIEF